MMIGSRLRTGTRSRVITPKRRSMEAPVPRLIWPGTAWSFSPVCEKHSDFRSDSAIRLPVTWEDQHNSAQGLRICVFAKLLG